MSSFIKKRLVYQIVTYCFALALTASCSMPDKPEGADKEGLTHIGDQLRSQGNDEGAVDFYQRALQRKPDDVAARKSLAEILEAHGNNEAASVQYSEGLKTDPKNMDFLRGHGRVLIKLGQPNEAKLDYEKALKIDSDDVKSLNGLGIVLDSLGQHEAAQKNYKKALDEKADDKTTLNNLAHSYVLSGDYQAAIQLLEPHVKEEGTTPTLRQNLAEAYGLKGMEADAERMARMDLTPDQVKHNLTLYRARHAKLSLTTPPAVDLGSFATDDMAEAHAEDIRTRYDKELKGLILATIPKVKAMNGTPSFTLHVTGFTKQEQATRFCEELKDETLICEILGEKGR